MSILRFARFMFVFVVLLHGVSCFSETASPSSLLWGNKFSEVQKQYSAAKTPDALLALALVATWEDRPTAAMAQWERYYRVEPASWQAEAFWPKVVWLSSQCGGAARLESISRVLAAAKGVSPQLRASARLVLAYAPLRQKKVTESDALIAKMGFVRNWRVIGPFDNVSDSGFDKVYPPEQKINLTAGYAGLNGLKVAWRPLGIIGRGDFCEVGEAMDDSGPSVFYALTAVNAKAAGPAVLCLDPQGACKAYLNGERVFADSLYREQDKFVADPFRVPVKLKAGWNTLLLKIASDNDVTAAYRVRFTTSAGEEMVMPADPQNASSAPTAKACAPVGRVVADTAATARLRALPARVDTLHALGYCLLRCNDLEGSITALRSALALSPNSGALHWVLSRAFGEDGRMNDLREERDAARKACPSIVQAELEYLNEQEELSEPKVLGILKRMSGWYPESPSVAGALCDAYDGQDMQREAIAAAIAAKRIAPGEDNFTNLLYLYDMYDFKSDYRRVLAEAQAQHPDSATLLDMQASQFTDQGQHAKAVPIYQTLLQLVGPLRGYRLALAYCYSSMKKTPLAVATLRKLHEDCPNDSFVCGKLAEELRTGGNKNEALALYARALQLDPSQTDLRDKMRAITGAPAEIDIVPAIDAKPILAGAGKVTAKDGAGSVMLLHDTRELIYPDFSTETISRVIVKIIDDSGVKQWGEVYPRIESATADVTVKSAKLIKANGKTQDLTADSYIAAAFPSLSAGDVIDVAFRIRDYHPGGLARHFWATYSFSHEGVPTSLVRYTLIAPKGLSFQTSPHGEVPVPTVKEVNGWQVHEWRAADVPALRSEPMAVEEQDSGSWLDISTIPSWREIVRWYGDLSGPLCVPDSAVRAIALELTKDCTTEQEKIRALAAFTADKIRYQTTPFRMSQFIPTRGKNVLRDEFGDCKDKAALLVAMLSAVGIQAEMALVNTRDDGLTPFLPSPRFTHAITLAHTEGGPLWIDGTADKLPLGMLPIGDQGVNALVIKNGVAELTTTPILSANLPQSKTEIAMVVEADGKMTAEAAYSFTADRGWMVRSAVGRVPESQYDQILRSVASKFWKEAAFDGGQLENVSDAASPLTVRIKFKADQYATTAGDVMIMRLPFDNSMGQLAYELTDKVRTRDLETSYLLGNSSTIVRVKLPAGYKEPEITAPAEQTTPFGRYGASCAMEGDTFVKRVEYTIATPRVAAADVPAFREFISAIYNEIQKPLALHTK